MTDAEHRPRRLLSVCGTCPMFKAKPAAMVFPESVSSSCETVILKCLRGGTWKIRGDFEKFAAPEKCVRLEMISTVRTIGEL